MCSAPEQTAELPPGTDLAKESVLVGKVTSDGSPVGGAYVRLLDGTRPVLTLRRTITVFP